MYAMPVSYNVFGGIRAYRGSANAGSFCSTQFNAREEQQLYCVVRTCSREYNDIVCLETRGDKTMTVSQLGQSDDRSARGRRGKPVVGARIGKILISKQLH